MGIYKAEWVILRVRSYSLCSLHYKWTVLDDKVGEEHYWLLISNVTSWFWGTILIYKTYMLGVAARSIHFICLLCRLFSPSYYSVGDRWAPKLNDGSQSFLCWATLSGKKLILEKMLSQFELLSVLVFFIHVCIIYMTSGPWKGSSDLSCL